ncbi:MAG: hypothetical protein QXU17_04560, partial [Archaeoglobaceae archaeon]
PPHHPVCLTPTFGELDKFQHQPLRLKHNFELDQKKSTIPDNFVVKYLNLSKQDAIEMELKEKVEGQITIRVTGTVFVALALFGFLSIVTGISFNKLQPGLGDLLIVIGVVSFIILVILAFLYRTFE